MKPRIYKSDNRAQFFWGILASSGLLLLMFSLGGSQFILLLAFSLLSIFFFIPSEYFIKNGKIIRRGVGEYLELSSEKIKHPDVYILKISEITKIDKVQDAFGSKGLVFFVGEYPMVKLFLKERDVFLKAVLNNNPNIKVLQG